MAQSLSQIYLHIVFSTKERRPFLKDHETRRRVHACLAKICNDFQCPCVQAGGFEDHVHVLCRLARTMSTSDLIKELKRSSSAWVKEHFSNMRAFYWQNGFGAFSVSPSHVPALRRYIQDQEEHHRRESFQDEFRRLLRKYGIDFDERFVWD